MHLITPDHLNNTHAVPQRVELKAVGGHGLFANEDVQGVGKEITVKVSSPAKKGHNVVNRQTLSL